MTKNYIISKINLKRMKYRPNFTLNTPIFNVLLLLLVFSSCRSSKDLTYIEDVKGEQNLKSLTQTGPTYKIKKKDNLFVSILSSNPEMNKLYNPAFSNSSSGTIPNQMYDELTGQYIYGYEVDQEGNIILPLIGKIRVDGRTIAEAEEVIQGKAEELLKEVTVKVRLLNYKITVMGEVENPGVYYNYNSEVTIFDAISMANGITNYAKIEKVQVLRPSSEGNLTFEVNLNSKSALMSEAYFLQPNDVVFVQPAKFKNTQLRLPLYGVFLSTVSTFLLLLNYLN